MGKRTDLKDLNCRRGPQSLFACPSNREWDVVDPSPCSLVRQTGNGTAWTPVPVRLSVKQGMGRRGPQSLFACPSNREWDGVVALVSMPQTTIITMSGFKTFSAIFLVTHPKIHPGVTVLWKWQSWWFRGHIGYSDWNMNDPLMGVFSVQHFSIYPEIPKLTWLFLCKRQPVWIWRPY